MNNIISFWILVAIMSVVPSCKNEPIESIPSISGKNSPSSRPVPGLVFDFQRALSNLDVDEVNSIGVSTDLFKEFVGRTKHVPQKDSLFMPFFQSYNMGRSLLVGKDKEMISSYGFITKGIDGVVHILPSKSEYLQTNVIHHFSPHMQQFCNQQLQEFEEDPNLDIMLHNTLWWEKFLKNNPGFFLERMTRFHYKNWHLKNLLTGTRLVEVFTEDGIFKDEAKSAYQKFIDNNKDSEISEVLSSYLDVLSTNNMKRVGEVEKFIAQFNG